VKRVQSRTCCPISTCLLLHEKVVEVVTPASAAWTTFRSISAWFNDPKSIRLFRGSNAWPKSSMSLQVLILDRTTLEGYFCYVNTVASSSDAELIASAPHDNTVRLRDAAFPVGRPAGMQRRDLPYHASMPFHLCLNRNSTRQDCTVG
jgi:hypothetical protein